VFVIGHKQNIIRERQTSRGSEHGVGRTGGLCAERGLSDYRTRGLAGQKIGCGAGNRQGYGSSYYDNVRFQHARWQLLVETHEVEVLSITV
jgi:hypothetical protein